MRNLPPGPLIERTIKDINEMFQKINHWTCFGALYGLIRNRGVIPDGDFDVCCHYGTDWKEIAARAEKRGYTVKKTMVDDQDNRRALFMGLFKEDMYICVSFWYTFKDLSFWCHDQSQEVISGVGTPKTGYYFKGCPKEFVDNDSKFIRVEWPGIEQRTTIRVPIFAGTILDLCYPAWPYLKQRYVPSGYRFDESKCVSINDPTYCKGVAERAFSMYRVKVNSMSEFNDTSKINKQLGENRMEWFEALKKRKY
jgi:hypothetical protein